MSCVKRPFKDCDLAIFDGDILIPVDSEFWQDTDEHKLEILQFLYEAAPEFNIIQWFYEKIYYHSSMNELRRTWRGDDTHFTIEELEIVLESRFVKKSTKEMLLEARETQNDTDEISEREYSNIKPKMRKEIMKRDNYTCAYCHRKLEIKEIQIDHKIPFSRGGKTLPENLCVSCRSCNIRKKDKTPEEFIQSFVYAI